MEHNNYEDKTTKTGESAKRKKTFWGKPNWVATLLVAVLLVVGCCYLGGDLILYHEACQERAVLAESAEKAILYRSGTTPIDLGKVEEKAEEINNKVQTLADKTDLGEYFAANDLSAEGRDVNKVVLYTSFTIFAVGVMYVLMQVIHVVALIAKACGKKKNHSGHGGAAA